MNTQKVKKTVVLDAAAAAMLAEQSKRDGISESALMARAIDDGLLWRAIQRNAERRQGAAQ